MSSVTAPARLGETQRISIATSQDATATKSGFASINAGRLISAFIVVWVHLAVGPFGGGAFMLATISLALTAKPDGRNISERARRLLIPWVLWSVIYGVVRGIAAYWHGQPILDAFPDGWSTILSGTSFHLWYLPFAFVATLAAIPLLRMTQRPLIWVGVASVALIVCAKIRTANHFSGAQDHWIQNLPAVFLGISLACFGKRAARQQVIGAMAVFLLASIFVANGYSMLPVWVGAVVACTAWCIRIPSPPALSRLAGMTYGVYLIHMAVKWVLCTLLGVAINRAYELPGPSLLGLALLTYVGSFAIVAVASKSRLRVLVGM